MIDKNIKLMTYEELKKQISLIQGFSYLESNNAIHIYYNYKKANEERGSNTIQQPLFIISKIKAFDFRTPYGFRLTNMKNIEGLSDIETAVIQLSKTPLYLRK